MRIISAPKITVLNNKAAKISQGVSIPISVVSAAGTQTQFVQADLALEVTPYVSQRDCAIAMNLDVTKNEPDFVNVGARGDPTILRKEAKTHDARQDGETSVLGGIYTRNSGLAYKKVPFFGDLPVLGWFFKNRRENDDRTEILVFITPKITNKALAALPAVGSANCAMPAPLFLIGFMAAGKTSVGRALAEATGRRFVDLDDVIADARASRSPRWSPATRPSFAAAKRRARAA